MADDFKVPIRNVFWMLCYAWDLYDYTDEDYYDSSAFDNIYNLLAKMLVKEVKTLLKRGFYREYIEETDTTSKIRGQINITETINRMTLLSNKVVCTYDEYSENVLFNQIIISTIIDLIRCQYVDDKQKIELNKLKLQFGNIDYINVDKYKFKKLVFNRNNINYLIIINICKLFRFGLVADQKEGKLKFWKFLDEKTMSRVYEMFLLNFYRRKLSKSKYFVHAPHISWQMEEEYDSAWDDLFYVDKKPVDRRTDIVIENKKENIQLIIDAKYYEKTFVNAYMSDEDSRVRTSHLNQVRGYVLDSPYWKEHKNAKVIGSLIYPLSKEFPLFVSNDKVEKGILYPITNSTIVLKTINLSNKWEDIETDLLGFVDRLEKLYIIKE